MRFVKEIENDYCKTQLYSFNNKYIIKFEAGMYEQIYKVSELEISGEDEIDEMLGDSFYKGVVKRFQEMEEEFEKIIDSID
ncbi:hypothetical protein [Lacihabitans lacunae]|jgi:hypothetical protein|uniref:Uncharacterized protein n=1 Tax=Lacihabitans lacunae TaxID=1028214 RepID=A0ABV7YTZ6_9BACT